MIHTDSTQRVCRFYVETHIKGILDKQSWVRSNMTEERSSFFVRLEGGDDCRFYFEDQKLAVSFLMLWGNR
jgi:hypothetical protein